MLHYTQQNHAQSLSKPSPPRGWYSRRLSHVAKGAEARRPSARSLLAFTNTPSSSLSLLGCASLRLIANYWAGYLCLRIFLTRTQINHSPVSQDVSPYIAFAFNSLTKSYASQCRRRIDSEPLFDSSAQD